MRITCGLIFTAFFLIGCAATPLSRTLSYSCEIPPDLRWNTATGAENGRLSLSYISPDGQRQIRSTRVSADSDVDNLRRLFSTKAQSVVLGFNTLRELSSPTVADFMLDRMTFSDVSGGSMLIAHVDVLESQSSIKTARSFRVRNHRSGVDILMGQGFVDSDTTDSFLTSYCY